MVVLVVLYSDFQSIDVQVDYVVLFILYISFVILLGLVCSVLMPCPFLLLPLSAHFVSER